MELRPYQNDFIADIREESQRYRSICCVLPTGGGKTVCFAHMVARILERGGTAHLLAHRSEIVDQISEKLSDYGISHGRIQSDRSRTRHACQVGMITVYKNRLAQIPPPDVLVIDECHHTPASQYATILSSMPHSTSILGFTATPERLDGKGLGQYYETMAVGATTPELISLGYLAPPVVYAPALIQTKELHTKYGDFDKIEAETLLDEPSITGDAVDHYLRFAKDTSAVAFCVTIRHAIHVAERFNAAGIRASHIDGGMDRVQRRRILEAFRRKEILVLTSCSLVDEGFDLPLIATAIDLSPTKSLSRYLQRIGRALRPAEGKDRAIILDHVQNTLRHGMPDAHREWSLEGAKARKKTKEIDVSTCSVCYLVYTGRTCPNCKIEELRGPGRQIEQREGELKEITGQRNWLTKEEIESLWDCESKSDIENYCQLKGVKFDIARNVLIRRARSLEDLQRVGRLLEYKPGWAQHRYMHSGARFGKQGQMEIAL